MLIDHDSHDDTKTGNSVPNVAPGSNTETYIGDRQLALGRRALLPGDGGAFTAMTTVARHESRAGIAIQMFGSDFGCRWHVGD